jgi:hypothetical protein
MFNRKLESEPAAAKLKEYDMSVDYCACMVAVAIA